MTNYGAFIEIEPGVEGLIHVSEISWTKHVKNPSEQYTMGDKVVIKSVKIKKNDIKSVKATDFVLTRQTFV